MVLAARKGEGMGDSGEWLDVLCIDGDALSNSSELQFSAVRYSDGRSAEIVISAWPYIGDESSEFSLNVETARRVADYLKMAIRHVEAARTTPRGEGNG